MSLSLYFDDDFVKHPRQAVLVAAGFDVVIPRDIGMAGADDADHLEAATRLGRVLLSHNMGDFQRIHGEWLERGMSHSGIVLLRQRLLLSPGEIGRRLWIIDSLFAGRGIDNQILFLSNFG